MSNAFDSGRYYGFRFFDRMAESADGRANRGDVLLAALEIATLSEADYIELIFGAKGNPSYIDHVADTLCLPGVYEFFAHFRKDSLTDGEKRQWFAGFVDGIVGFHKELGFPKPEKTPRERFSAILG